MTDRQIEEWDASFFDALFNHVPQVFTWFDDWVMHGNEWQSKHGINGNGDGKTHIRKKTPFCASDWKDGNIQKSTVKMFAEHHGITHIEAKAQMASIIGIPFPDGELLERMKAEAAAEAKKANAIKIAVDALQANDTSEAKRTAAYLHAYRGYKDADLVKRMGLGCLTAEAKKAFEEAGIQCGLKEGIFGDHLLMIPTYNFGKLASITIRNVNGQCEKDDRHRHIYPKEVEKHIHGIDAINSTDLVLVEGEIDALHIKALNALQWDEDAIIDVAAIGTNNISPTIKADIRTLARKKDANGRQILKSITILFDAGEDEGGKAKASTIKAIEDATNGMVKVYVASLPLEAGETKADADTYLNTHPLEALKKVVDEATTSPVWLFNRTIDQYARMANDNTANLTPKQWDAFEEDIAGILAFADTNEQRQMMRTWETSGRDANMLMMKAAAMKAKAAETSTRKAASSYMEEAIKRIEKSTNVGADMDAIIAELKAMKMDAKQSEVEDILHIPSKDEVLNEWKMMREGIPMPYVFKLGRNTDECQQFQIPSAALTYVAAPTSNGKSCMLQNMALYTAAQCGKDESILYFVFEESKRDTIMEMLAIYSGKAYSNRNKSTIKSYLRNGETKFFKDKSRGPWHLQKAMDAFLGKYITSGKIRIYDKDTDATHLVDIMMKAAQQTKVKAIFIDYMQKMHDTNIASKAFGRDQELCGICDALNTFCNESGLPVVLAAQISRTGSKSPMEMSCNTIADASSIEKAAHAIILLYQNKGHYTGASKEWQPSTFVNRLKAKGIAPEAETEKMESIFPEDGRNKIWMRIDKYRGEESGGEMVFEFYGASGRIKPNIQQFAGIEGIEEDSIPKDVMFDTAEAGNGDLFEDTDKETNEDIIAF